MSYILEGTIQRERLADPDFAEAYARLAEMHLCIRWFGYDLSPEHVTRAKEAIDRALLLKPENAVVREANGYYYYYELRDYARALDEFTLCLRKEPGNAWHYANISYVQRHLGRFEEALENLKIASQYDPRSNLFARDFGVTYRELFLYKEGEKAINLLPVSRDAMLGPDYLYDLAEIYTIVGDHEAAIDKLEVLLKIPAGVHIGSLKVNPVWNPLRNHPRFQILLEEGI
ncbi:hypothetical protein JXO59_04345 [candidate division KSB1 bacterium]|nr:hypothetical protein [candidate division KSB1 bacterium]